MGKKNILREITSILVVVQLNLYEHHSLTFKNICSKMYVMLKLILSLIISD